jgi:hypothetical protein
MCKFSHLRQDAARAYYVSPPPTIMRDSIAHLLQYMAHTLVETVVLYGAAVTAETASPARKHPHKCMSAYAG